MILNDDMRTPQGIKEGTALTFSNSWKAEPSCSDMDNGPDDPCSSRIEIGKKNKTKKTHQCCFYFDLRFENKNMLEVLCLTVKFSVKQVNIFICFSIIKVVRSVNIISHFIVENYAKHWCEMLRNPNGSFANCHSDVNPAIYYKVQQTLSFSIFIHSFYWTIIFLNYSFFLQRCLYSTCNCDKSEDGLCAVLTSYGRACAAKGKFVTDFGNECGKILSFMTLRKMKTFKFDPQVDGFKSESSQVTIPILSTK